ncbi:hypothetical protein AMTR_s00047p00223950 [Amborella trichopoda]|uniref:Uncharacterized protein n=2 Tax=Amborella trichopoda TaxID=13333 RepID=U5D618_AMBTC|nr:hypothetical protein AMTR_s00047p00223950 [Amborella trichopoda]
MPFGAGVKDTVVALAAKKAINKKRRTRSRQRKAKTYDLSSLAEFLPNLDDLKQPDPHPLKLKVDCKNRRKLLEKEHDQFRAVLDHPAFQSEPIAAVYQHLEKTCSLLADDNGSKRLVARSKKGEAYGSKRKKGSKSKILPDAQSMLLN